MLVLHIGFPKTGTTSIQNFMSTHREVLAMNGVLYPRIGPRQEAHHLLAERRADGQFQLGDWTEVIALAAENPDKMVFLSSERLVPLGIDSIRQLQIHLSGIDVRIIVYIRCYPEWLVSRYTQNSKSGKNSFNFDEYYNNQFEPFSNYVITCLMNWVSVWGTDHVRVRLAEPEGLVGRDLIEDALSTVGLSCLKLGANSKDHERKNTRPGWITIEVLRAVFTRVARAQGRNLSPTTPVLEPQIATHFRNLVINLLQVHGLEGDNADYLTSEQIVRGDRRFAAMVEEINLMHCFNLSTPDRRPSVGRSFLPSIDAVSPDHLERVREVIEEETRSCDDPERERNSGRQELVRRPQSPRRDLPAALTTAITEALMPRPDTRATSAGA